MNGSSQDPGSTPESGSAPAKSSGEGAVAPSFTVGPEPDAFELAGGPTAVCGCGAEPVTIGIAGTLGEEW